MACPVKSLSLDVFISEMGTSILEWMRKLNLLIKTSVNFSGDPVVKSLHFQCREQGFDHQSGN